MTCRQRGQTAVYGGATCTGIHINPLSNLNDTSGTVVSTMIYHIYIYQQTTDAFSYLVP